MAAIITESHRRELARMFVEDFKDPNNDYFIGLGQPTDWLEETSAVEPIPFPNGGGAAEKVIKDNLTDIVRVSGTSCGICIPNFEPESGIYKDYDPFDSSCYYPSGAARPPFIVNQNSGDIYVLLYNTPGSSITFDTIPALPAFAAFLPSTGGGSLWAHVGRVLSGSVVSSNRFKLLADDLTDSSLINTRRSFSGSAVYGFHIANTGNGYQSAPSINLYGYNNNGEQSLLATLSATIENGKISGISNADIINELFDTASPSNNLFKHKGYVNYTVKVTGGGPTVAGIIYPKVAPKDGFGVKNSDILPNWYVGFAVNTNTADGVRSVFSRYSQVSLIKNFELFDQNLSGAVAYNMLRGIETEDSIATFTRGGRITAGTGSGTKFIGVIDSVDPIAKIIWYISNHEYGYAQPVQGESVTVTPEGSSSGIPISVSGTIEPVIDKNTGQTVFVDNRAFITRNEGQNEELKIAIQL